MSKADILIIDDEADIRLALQGILQDEGYAIRQAGNSDDAYAQIEDCEPNLVILDIWLKDSTHDGLQILETIKAAHADIPVLMISGHGTIETAVSAIKQGAYDFIEKPFKTDRLLLMIERALENAKLVRENKKLREKAQGPSELVGDSHAITALRQMLSRVAQTNSRVLITGEPGTGKEIAARLIHRMSQRAQGPFVALNCAILHPERLEAELFGVEDEAVKTGLLEQADGGTLLLDEVADMPAETQGKIVRVLQDQKFQRLGGQDFIEVDVRIIAASNRDLEKAMEQGDFRKDLYFRLNVVPIELPPLRDHLQDIGALTDYFIEQFAAQTGMPPCRLAKSTLAALQAYDWPGNVRQLRNLVERLMIMGGGAANDDDMVRPDQLPSEIVGGAPGGDDPVDHQTLMSAPLREAREMFEREYLASQIKRFDGNISKTAEFVGMERSALHRKLKQLGITAMAKHNERDESSAA
ncbi:MAG: sigma-54-dependent Fis family transcriptional regulator [Rhodospirillales bacterium]|nr:sigma-54-dependent Fis family transcriptional regulator [Rhodospirillales bacterium]